MKLKLMPMLSGAITLTVAAAPLAVKAQFSPSQPTPGQQGQNSQPSQPTPGQQGQNRPGATGIQLTQQQRQKLVQIRRDTSAQIQKILRPEQQNKFKAALQAGQDRKSAFAAMNLSSEQQAQLRKITQAANSQVESILTPEQRQQIQQNIQKRQQQ